MFNGTILVWSCLGLPKSQNESLMFRTNAPVAAISDVLTAEIEQFTNTK